MIVVSFHTGAEPYVSLAKRLEESCEKLGLECWIAELPDRGTWIENVVPLAWMGQPYCWHAPPYTHPGRPS